MKRSIITTSDGSKTIQIEDWDEQYHSIHGAIQESHEKGDGEPKKEGEGSKKGEQGKEGQEGGEGKEGQNGKQVIASFFYLMSCLIQL